MNTKNQSMSMVDMDAKVPTLNFKDQPLTRMMVALESIALSLEVIAEMAEKQAKTAKKARKKPDKVAAYKSGKTYDSLSAARYFGNDITETQEFILNYINKLRKIGTKEVSSKGITSHMRFEKGISPKTILNLTKVITPSFLNENDLEKISEQRIKI